MASHSRHDQRGDDEEVVDESQPLLAESPSRQQQQQQPQNRLAAAWQTTVAAAQVYRTELASRFAKATSGRRRGDDGGDAAVERDGTNTSRDRRARSCRSPGPITKACLWTLGGLIALLIALTAIESSHLFLSTLSAPTEDQQARILDEALVLKGPDSVRLLNISDDGIQVQIDGRLGLDPDRALDIWLGQRARTSWWKKRDRHIVEWALAKVAGVKVELGQLTIAEPDWTKDVPTEDLDLIPGQSKHPRSDVDSSIEVAAKPASPPPRDLLAFNIDPLLVPLPELLRTSSEDDDDDDPVLGGNSTRRARLTMRPLNLTLLFKPVTPAPYLAQLGQRAVKQGNATLDINVRSLSVRGLTWAQMGEKKKGSSWIPRFINLGQKDITKRVRQQIPKLDVGNSTDEFLNLTRYDFFEINGGSDAVEAAGQKALGIRAYAEAKNPLGNLLKGSVRYSLPFGVFLPAAGANGSLALASKPIDTVLLAVIASDPFELDGQEKLQLQLEGRVVPPPPSGGALQAEQSQPAAPQHVFSASQAPPRSLASPSEDALGNFLSRFLRGEANTVYVRGGSPFEHPDPALPGAGSPDLPGWLSSALSVMDVPISFPGSKVTDLIKNVTIQDLKIKTHPWSKEKLLFSGTILGELSMPGELAAVDVEIRYLWPDILIYDGKPPSMKHPGGGDGDDDDDGGDDDDDDDTSVRDGDEDDGGEPLPSPLPNRAFGRVRPHSWANATTTPDPDDPSPHPRKILRSQLVDVPFTVLPGRSKEFRSYSWKLITGEGAETGIEGSSKVKIWNSGLGDLEISKLPVSGAFMVGKRGGDDDDDD